jgi:hypothetical protein
VLTVSYPGGRTQQISLSAEQKPLVQQWLRNYHKLRPPWSASVNSITSSSVRRTTANPGARP